MRNTRWVGTCCPRVFCLGATRGQQVPTLPKLSVSDFRQPALEFSECAGCFLGFQTAFRLPEKLPYLISNQRSICDTSRTAPLSAEVAIAP